MPHDANHPSAPRAHSMHASQHSPQHVSPFFCSAARLHVYTLPNARVFTCVLLSSASVCSKASHIWLPLFPSRAVICTWGLSRQRHLAQPKQPPAPAPQSPPTRGPLTSLALSPSGVVDATSRLRCCNLGSLRDLDAVASGPYLQSARPPHCAIILK